MYSKDEASQLRQAFWTTFGQYIAPHLSADGMKINWVNYKTGIKYLYFKMEADKASAQISIVISHPDEDIRKLYFEQFAKLRSLFQNAMNEEWNWQLGATDDYVKPLSLIFKQITGVSIFNKSDWPGLISFFKPRIIALDEFWSNAQYAFDGLK